MASQNLNVAEKIFSVFSFIFLTGILRWTSLFVAPDPMLSSISTYNPFDPVSALIQYVIYAITLFFLVARPKGSLYTISQSSLIWIISGLAIASFLWSDFSDLSLRRGIATLQTASFGLYIASRFSVKQQLQILAWAIGIVAILSVVFTVVFPGAAIEAGANAGAWRGPFTQKNILARLMVLGTLIFLLLSLERSKNKYIFWVGESLCFLLLLLSDSKTGLVLFFAMITLIPLYNAFKWKGNVLIPFLILLVLASSSLSILLITNWENLLTSLGRDPTLSGRSGLWELAIQKITERPWLGYGYQGFWQSGGGAEIIWRTEGYRPPHAHNGFINIALDLGLIGLALFVLSLINNYFRAINWLRSGSGILRLWPILYITFFFLYNHSENTILEQNSIFWTLFVSVSLSCCLSRKAAIERSFMMSLGLSDS